MKRSRFAFICISLLMFGWLWTNWHPVSVQVTAQDSPKSANSQAASKTVAAAKGDFEWASGQSFPNFNLDEVLESLKVDIEKLITKKLTKNSDEFRQQMSRTSFSAKLPPVSTKEIPAQELYRRAIESVYLVVGLTRPKPDKAEWRSAFSTAFVVHEDGVLSTSAHVFDHDEHDDAVVVFDVKGNLYPIVELLAVDRKSDTCLFRVAAKNLKPIPLASNPSPGSEIRVVGHPGDSLFYFTAGHVGNYEHDEDGQIWMNITADFGQGSSGGPVMDNAGNVVGQVSRTYTLYASGDSTNRGRRIRKTQQTTDVKPKGTPKKEEPQKEESVVKSSDPQMVFKACTPVSAIRAMVK